MRVEGKARAGGWGWVRRSRNGTWGVTNEVFAISERPGGISIQGIWHAHGVYGWENEGKEGLPFGSDILDTEETEAGIPRMK